jgi:hypothetical protein
MEKKHDGLASLTALGVLASQLSPRNHPTISNSQPHTTATQQQHSSNANSQHPRESRSKHCKTEEHAYADRNPTIAIPAPAKRRNRGAIREGDRGLVQSEDTANTTLSGHHQSTKGAENGLEDGAERRGT